MLDFVVWYIIISLVGLITLPIAYRLLPYLADRGYILGRALGLLLWGFAFWLLTSFNILQNDTGGVVISLLLLVVTSLLLAGGWHGCREVFKFLRGRLRLVIITEVLFLAAFLFLALLRAAAPDISGTEKPMEMAFINSILHSSGFPPSDPWLSGYAISYYYFGYVLVAMLIRLSGVTSGVGFNLAISLWYALTALSAYGVAYSLLASWSKRRQSHGKPAIFAQGWALLSPFYVLVVSNLGGFLEMLHAGGVFWTPTTDGMQSNFWKWLDIPELVNPPSLPLTWIPNRPGGIWWWRASRVVQDYTLSGKYNEVIDEFPAFSYYLADLHPHVLAMPFVLVAIALALNLYLWGTSQKFSELPLRKWVRRIEFWLAAVVLGGLSFLNTWDFPIYLALFSAVFTLARFQQEGWHWKARLQDFIGQFLALGAAGIILYLPFYFGFQSQAGGILPSLAFFTRGIQFWIMFTPLLIPLFAWLIWLWRRRGGRLSFRNGLRFSLVIIAALAAFSWLLGFLGTSLPVIGNSLSLSQSPAIANLGATLNNLGNLFISNQGATDPGSLLINSFIRRITSPGTWLTLGILMTLVWGILSTYHPFILEGTGSDGGSKLQDAGSLTTPALVSSLSGSPTGFILLLVLVGIGLTLLPEFVYLRDQFGSRMNTIFKFYFQTWILWGVSAAVVSVILIKELGRLWRMIFGLVWIVVLFMALAYPVFTLSDRLNFSQANRWTLDGEASFANYDSSDMAAIQWLQTAPYGAVAEAVGGQYSEFARIATHSGLPALLGWPLHEVQWRGSAKEIGSRETDTGLLYTTSDWQQALTICQQYHVRYVVIGDLERAKYKVNEAKFKSHLTPVFQSGSTSIYEIPALSLSAN
ncbi:MAG TPA: DUF2298 domain-containing protein [Anaerolineaceae bacterium]